MIQTDKPTDAMIEAGVCALMEYPEGGELDIPEAVVAIYTAMRSSAPQEPVADDEMLRRFESAVRVNENMQGTTDRIPLEMSRINVEEHRAALLARLQPPETPYCGNDVEGEGA